MAAAGVRLVRRVERVAVVGGTEALGRLPALWSAFRALRQPAPVPTPPRARLIDFPEFNLRLARVARRLGVPVVYFMAPQLWAWRPGRIHAMARDVSRVLAIFPFEVGLYQEAGVPVEFVGHPVLDVLPDAGPGRRRARVSRRRERRWSGLLPGSRDAEVRRHLPVLLGAARADQSAPARGPASRCPSPLLSRRRRSPAGAVRSGLPVEVLSGEAYRVMAAADLVLVASGHRDSRGRLLRRPDGRAVPALRAVARARPPAGPRGVAHQPPEHRGGPGDRPRADPGAGHAGRGRGGRASSCSRTRWRGRPSGRRCWRSAAGWARRARASARRGPSCGSAMGRPIAEPELDPRAARASGGGSGLRAGDLAGRRSRWAAGWCGRLPRPSACGSSRARRVEAIWREPGARRSTPCGTGRSSSCRSSTGGATGSTP